MNESQMSSAFCKRLKDEAGAMVYPLVGQTRGVSGWPDRLIVSKWWTGLIEFKLGNGALSKLQSDVIVNVSRRAPGFVFVAWMEAVAGEPWRLFWPEWPGGRDGPVVWSVEPMSPDGPVIDWLVRLAGIGLGTAR